MGLSDVFAEWLTRPKWGSREKPRSYYFLPYSVKVGDHVQLYSPERWNHWITVEWDSNIVTFNERPPKIEIPSGGRLHSIQFDMACLCHSEQLVFRRLISDASPDLEEAIDHWAAEAGLGVERIDPASFAENAVALNNKKELLHFIRVAYGDPLEPDGDQLMDFIARSPGVTVAQVQHRFRDADPTTVIAVIGKLMINGRVAANLSSRPFDRNLALAPK